MPLLRGTRGTGRPDARPTVSVGAFRPQALRTFAPTRPSERSSCKAMRSPTGPPPTMSCSPWTARTARPATTRCRAPIDPAVGKTDRQSNAAQRKPCCPHSTTSTPNVNSGTPTPRAPSSRTENPPSAGPSTPATARVPSSSACPSRSRNSAVAPAAPWRISPSAASGPRASTCSRSWWTRTEITGRRPGSVRVRRSPRIPGRVQRHLRRDLPLSSPSASTRRLLRVLPPACDSRCLRVPGHVQGRVRRARPVRLPLQVHASPMAGPPRQVRASAGRSLRPRRPGNGTHLHPDRVSQTPSAYEGLSVTEPRWRMTGLSFGDGCKKLLRKARFFHPGNLLG
ncbi:hypothetical protein A3Q37_06552 [Streptomyces sp. PTY087I2]|nr:hypothetical protein A3Q37_06552 [Streptomyces sp. PTY087I2]